jgi:hypothetical protein
MSHRPTLITLVVALAGASAFVYACDAHDATPGGAVTGPVDDHCGATATTVDPSTCQPGDAGTSDAKADVATDAALDGPQKHEEPAPGPPTDAGVLFNQSGSDEDCKYDFQWTATPVELNANVTFTVTVKHRATKAPALGATPYVEAYLDATHPAPNSGAKTVDQGGGVYAIGPIRFDRSGYWTVKFHVYDTCVDGPTSPHGHASFYVSVP